MTNEAPKVSHALRLFLKRNTKYGKSMKNRNITPNVQYTPKTICGVLFVKSPNTIVNSIIPSNTASDE